MYSRVVIVSYRGPLEHPAAPERSPDQRMAALNMAELRTFRAQLKRDLKAGWASIAPLLLDPPAFLQTAKVFDLLLAVPKVGRVKATKFLDSCRVSPSKTFGGLSDRQRAELAARLDR
ncbi:MAG: integration host factor, actinobacterial type [Solirubrobacteraceae bacterium]